MIENLSSMELNNSSVEPNENSANTAESIWKLMSLIRGSIDARDYHIIFFFLTIKQLGYLDKLNGVKAENLVVHIGDCIVTSSGSENEPDLTSLFNFYRPILERIEPAVLRNVLFALNNEVSLSDSSYPELFDVLLDRYQHLMKGFEEERALPTGIADVIAAMLELPQQARVYNPFSGLASFPLALKNIGYCLAQELSNQTWAMGYMRIIAHGMHHQVEWQHTDAIRSWAGGTYDKDGLLSLVNPTRYEQGFSQQFDLVISAPPIGMKFLLPASPSVAPSKSLESVLIENALRFLKPGGQVVAILSPSFLTKMGHEYHLRQYLLANNFIDAIVQFPAGLMHRSAASLVALFLKTDRQIGQAIKMIDASGFVVKEETMQAKLFDAKRFLHALFSGEHIDMVRHIGVHEIDKEDFNLAVRRFFVEQISDVRLGDVGSLLRSGRSTEGTTGKLVRMRYLKEPLPDFRLNDVGISDSDIPKSATRIAESCMLLPARWQSFRPVWFEYTGTPIYIMPDMLAFKPDLSKCDPVFLITELQADYIDKQVQQMATGQLIPTLRSKDVLSIQIKLPSLQEQKEMLADRRQILMKEKERELALFREIHGLEEEMLDRSRYLRHTLAGPASNLKSSVAIIRQVLQDQVASKVPGLFELKASAKDLYNLGNWLDILERDAQSIALSVARQGRVEDEIASKELKPVDIIAFLKEYVAEHQAKPDPSFEMKLEIDSVYLNSNGDYIATYILAHPDLLRGMMDNMLANAVQHAFPGHSNNRFEICVLNDGEEAGRSGVGLLLSNTGNRFPESITKADFSRKGFGTGLTAGDGFGGWYIHEVIRRMNGKWDIIDEQGPEGLPESDLATTFDIHFPIIDTDEHEDI